MHLTSHNDDLANRLNLLYPDADRQLAKELMELHENKCKHCQEDRLSCTVRPACKNRNFLNTLIELGIEAQDLPAFCYSVYINQIGRYISERKGRPMTDRRILIKDFLATLKVSSIRHFNSKFKKEWKNYVSVTQKDQMIVTGNNMLFHFDFSRGIVHVNPDNEQIDSFDILKHYTEVFSQLFKVSVDLQEITTNWWELLLTLNGTPEKNKLDVFLGKLPRGITNHSVVKDKNATRILLEVYGDCQSNLLTVKDVRELFNSFKSMVS